MPRDPIFYFPCSNFFFPVSISHFLIYLEQLNERLSKVVECRYFGGFTREETAEVLEVSVRTVERDWVKARGWLFQHMYGSSPTLAALKSWVNSCFEGLIRTGVEHSGASGAGLFHTN